MKVDFYHLARDPAHKAIAGIARNTLKAGKRLLVVSADDAQLGLVADVLWAESPASFLANGRAGTPDDARQPILLAPSPEPANGARFCAFADGLWRETEGFERIFFLFGEDRVVAARECWTALRGRDGLERRYWAQSPAGRWELKG